MTQREELPVSVKALEWSTVNRHGFNIHAGKGFGLVYEASIKAYSPGWIVTFGEEEVIFDSADADEDDAKAAAQADYEARILSALVASPKREPYGYLFQHEETGLESVVSMQQVEWGFEKLNPRLQKICPVYLSPPIPSSKANERAIGEAVRVFYDCSGGDVVSMKMAIAAYQAALSAKETSDD